MSAMKPAAIPSSNCSEKGSLISADPVTAPGEAPPDASPSPSPSPEADPVPEGAPPDDGSGAAPPPEPSTAAESPSPSPSPSPPPSAVGAAHAEQMASEQARAPARVQLDVPEGAAAHPRGVRRASTELRCDRRFI